MREWIKRFLSLNDLCTAAQLDEIRHEIMLLRNELVVTFNDETSPKRQSMSKELGERMIKKLKAEDMARKLTTGEL